MRVFYKDMTFYYCVQPPESRTQMGSAAGGSIISANSMGIKGSMVAKLGTRGGLWRIWSNRCLFHVDIFGMLCFLNNG